MADELARVVVLAEKGTPLAEFQKARTDAISRMFNRDKACGKIHSTTKFFVELDDSVSALLLKARREALEEAANLVEPSPEDEGTSQYANDKDLANRIRALADKEAG